MKKFAKITAMMVAIIMVGSASLTVYVISQIKKAKKLDRETEIFLSHI